MRIAVRVLVTVLLVLGGVLVAGPAGTAVAAAESLAPESPAPDPTAEATVAPDGVDATPAAALAATAGGSFIGISSATAFTGSVAAGATKRVILSGVPAGSAALVSVSVSSPGAAGLVTAFTAAAAVPAAPTLLFTTGQSVSNTAVIATSGTGAIDLKNSAAAAISLRVDVSGYYTAGAPAAAGLYGSITPTIVANAVAIPAKSSTTITATGIGGVAHQRRHRAGQPFCIRSRQATGTSRLPDRLGSSDHPKPGLLHRSPTVGPERDQGQRSRPIHRVQQFDRSGHGHRRGPRLLPDRHSHHRRQLSEGLACNTFHHNAGREYGRRQNRHGPSSVPATGVSAVVVELTASASTASGYLTSYPTGAARPTVPVVPVHRVKDHLESGHHPGQRHRKDQYLQLVDGSGHHSGGHRRVCAGRIDAQLGSSHHDQHRPGSVFGNLLHIDHLLHGG